MFLIQVCFTKGYTITTSSPAQDLSQTAGRVRNGESDAPDLAPIWTKLGSFLGIIIARTSGMFAILLYWVEIKR